MNNNLEREIRDAASNSNNLEELSKEIANILNSLQKEKDEAANKDAARKMLRNKCRQEVRTAVAKDEWTPDVVGAVAVLTFFDDESDWTIKQAKEFYKSITSGIKHSAKIFSMDISDQLSYLTDFLFGQTGEKVVKKSDKKAAPSFKDLEQEFRKIINKI